MHFWKKYFRFFSCTGLISHQWFDFCLVWSGPAACLQRAQGVKSSLICCNWHRESINKYLWSKNLYIKCHKMGPTWPQNYCVSCCHKLAPMLSLISCHVVNNCLPQICCHAAKNGLKCCYKLLCHNVINCCAMLSPNCLTCCHQLMCHDVTNWLPWCHHLAAKLSQIGVPCGHELTKRLSQSSMPCCHQLAAILSPIGCDAARN